MVNFTDLKFYYSTNSLGGAITGTILPTATPNAMFVNHERSQLTAGTDKYKCFYIKNESSEDMENFKIWVSNGTKLDYTELNMGFDDVANPFDGAVGFDGTDDYISCGNHSSLWSKAKSKFSFACWVWPTAVGDGNFRTIVDHGFQAGGAFTCYFETSGSSVSFAIRNAADTTSFIATSTGVVLNAWNHIVCVYDNSLGSANIKIYRNAVVGGTTGNLTESPNISADLTLAKSSTDFKGYMKDFKFWDTTALSSTEVTELYNDGEVTAKPHAYQLQFGERTGSTTRDEVGKTKTATLTNGTFWALSAIAISDTFTAPKLRANKWYDVGEIETKTFKIKPGNYVPIWCRLAVDPDPDATPVLDDNAIFTIKFDITSTGTNSGGTPGTGGGTGGSTGGTTTTAYKIAVAGDWGNTGDTTDVVNLMKNQNYNLIIGVGDNAYDDSSASSWCNKFSSFRDKMVSAYGNHEYEEDGGISPYKNFFGDSKTYYSHRFQNCLILIIDSNDDKSGVDLDAQRTWAKGVLESYKNDSKVVWRMVAMHHPWFGNGSKHSENEFDQVQKFHKLFTDYDVNFVFTGHNHNWHRSHQVAYNSSDPRDPSIVDSSSPYSRSGNGLIQVNSGSGGHDGPGDLYSLPDDDSFWAYRNKSDNGVFELVASNNGNTLTCRYRDIDNGTHGTFTITA